MGSYSCLHYNEDNLRCIFSEMKLKCTGGGLEQHSGTDDLIRCYALKLICYCDEY